MILELRSSLIFYLHYFNEKNKNVRILKGIHLQSQMLPPDTISGVLTEIQCSARSFTSAKSLDVSSGVISINIFHFYLPEKDGGT